LSEGGASRGCILDGRAAAVGGFREAPRDNCLRKRALFRPEMLFPDAIFLGPPGTPRRPPANPLALFADAQQRTGYNRDGCERDDRDRKKFIPEVVIAGHASSLQFEGG